MSENTQHLIEKWLEGSLSEEEKTAFEKSEDFESIQKLMNALNAFEAPEYDVEAGLARWQQNQPAKGKVIKMPSFTAILKIAAIILLICLPGYWLMMNTFSRDSTQIVAHQKEDLYLPDSSVVIMNNESKLTYSKDSWAAARKVSLSGEAYFKVAKGSKFDVKTEAGTITVLGTQFNVNQRNNYFEVSCYEGAVRVKAESFDIILKPGEAVRFIDGQLSTEKTSASNGPAWIKGESAFENVAFRYVVEELERQYNIDIIVKDFDVNQKFTGRFTNHDLDLALKTITVPLNLIYQTNSEQIVLSPENQ